MNNLPECPDRLPGFLVEPLRKIATEWARSGLRPKPSESVLAGWDKLLEAWIRAADLPLYVRRFNDSFTRGTVYEHFSGREIVPVDNTPAHWAFATAVSGAVPTLTELKRLIAEDRVPIAMILKRREIDGARYKCRGRKSLLLNEYGWKVCHRKPAKLGRGVKTEMPLEKIEAHFRRFMSPSNIFLVPLVHSGLGEIPHFIEVMNRTT